MRGSERNLSQYFLGLFGATIRVFAKLWIFCLRYSLEATFRNSFHTHTVTSRLGRPTMEGRDKARSTDNRSPSQAASLPR